MGEGPVTNPKKRPTWRLKKPHSDMAQGIVISGFSSLPSAIALFLEFVWTGNGPNDPVTEGKGSWLAALNKVAPITDADDPDPRAAAFALTWTGLQKMGLGADVLSTFSAPFREGMYQEDRLRRLGDRAKQQWQGTVIPNGPRWGGNTPARASDGPVLPGDGPKEPDEIPSPTPKTVHALLLLYEKTDSEASKWAAEVTAALAPHQVTVVHQLPLDLRQDPDKPVAREHFGFADGMSQPIPYDEKSGDESAPDCVCFGDGQPVERDKTHGVPLGEILLGHTNAHHEIAPGPSVRADDPRAIKAGLSPDGAPAGFLNLGLDGSYMVVRELQQRVAAFWKSLEDNAARIRAHDPSAAHVTAKWLAERIVGRDIDGHLLCPKGVLPVDEFGHPQNDFRFWETDPHGFGCPLGSHVRRSNPRDGLARDKASAQTLLDAANFHRILRRGRKYGTTLANRMQDDGSERGLLFICLNTDIARQFEFLQQTWLMNPNFATLFDETDPLVGPKGRFTIPNAPLRRIVEVETFIQMAGGEYFFLPSMPALKYLEQL
jgi:deferrochelatase/peroxidase EfeB